MLGDPVHRVRGRPAATGHFERDRGGKEWSQRRLPVPQLGKPFGPLARKYALREPGSCLQPVLSVDRLLEHGQEKIHAAEPVVDVLHKFGQRIGKAMPQFRERHLHASQLFAVEGDDFARPGLRRQSPPTQRAGLAGDRKPRQPADMLFQ